MRLALNSSYPKAVLR
ncbi:hypothetical protein NAI30_10465, partial [Francisella tularensis subsp. holarctica]|nr:hypothetical protein [Francisella tularensis subsp. holarctica]